MKIDSFYNDFDAWLSSHDAPLAALISKQQSGLIDRNGHEYGLIAIGLDETSWFIYCGQYDIIKDEE
ncbi:hypothetical protein LCGC14_1445660 [marine sediment metagenome]|uniref:Uncharacterized protein n=1 Tax=marine sediment metagenome TaxID=412755 RepID=A0A0F9LZU4_9ZZZZ